MIWEEVKVVRDMTRGKYDADVRLQQSREKSVDLMVKVARHRHGSPSGRVTREATFDGKNKLLRYEVTAEPA